MLSCIKPHRNSKFQQSTRAEASSSIDAETYSHFRSFYTIQTAMATCRILANVLLLFFVAYAAAEISNDCLDCICEVEGCDGQIDKCRPDGKTESCGPFQIQNPYWVDCGELEGDYKTCAMKDACSRTCVKAYMKRYAALCAGGTPTCQDYARIHNGGPDGCKESGTLKYWSKVEKCCNGKSC